MILLVQPIGAFQLKIVVVDNFFKYKSILKIFKLNFISSKISTHKRCKPCSLNLVFF